MRLKTFFISSIFLGALACETSTPKPTSTSSPQNEQSSSGKTEISYVLGHGFYQLILTPQENKKVLVESKLNHELLRKNSISADTYQHYLNDVTHFVKTQSTLQLQSECALPYTVVIINKYSTDRRQGCRGDTDASKLSQLIHDGEFLLYSKNP